MENFQKPSAPDGAFERFLTAALATIITIMFSWRLLTEENEGEDGDPRNVLLNYKPPIRPESSDNSDGDKDHISYESKEIRDISICGVNTPVEDTADRVVIPGESSAVQVVNDDEAHGDYCPSDDEDSPTWANYSWEEDMYGTVHTRRSVSDFVSSARQNSMTNENNDPSTTSNTLPVSPEQLEELYVNREYRSIVDNANYENMAISDSSESDSDDGEFELTNVDSEDDIYYPKPLEPIIEEDSDYDESASDSSSGDRNYFINNTPVCEPQILSTQCSNDILEDEKLVESAHGIIKSDKNAEIDHVKETCTLSGDKSSIEQSINSISTDVNTQEEIVLADLDDVCNEFDENDDDIKDYDDDSLPPSPVRTYALDDEGNLSDESCSTCSSSASVITVVSVDNVNKSKEKVENSVNDKNATGTTQAERDDLNSQEVNDNLHTDLIAFIHEGERSSIEQTDSLFTKNILPEQSSVGVIDTSQDLNSIYQDLQINTELPTITQKSKSSDDIDFSNQNENQSDENDDTTLDYEDFVNNIEANSENNLVIRTISPVCESVEQIQEPKDLDQKFEDEIDSEVSNEQARKSDTGSDVSQSDDEIDRFDDNIQPREYNPSDDDFCDFLLDQESDDDSFFVFVGNQNHLRKLDTVTNLDYIGKSQARDDLRNLSSSDDERTYVFSRTEEISTEHRFRCYVKDRENAELSSSDDNLIDVEEVDLHIQESAEGIGESDSKKSDELLQITERDDLLQITECDEESLENIDSGSKDDITEERIRQLNAVNAAINNTDLILAETIDSACTSPQDNLHNVREKGVNGHKENNAICPELSPPSETNSDLVSDNIDLEYVKNETKINDICDTKSPVETNTEFYSQTEQSDTNKNQVTELLRTDETDDLVDSQTEFQSESLLCSDTLVQRNHEPDINYVALNSEESNANVDFDNNVETFTEKDTLTRQIPHQLEFISNADAISHDQTTNADKLLSSTDTNNGSHKSDHIVDANGNSKTCNENECKMSNLDNVSLDSVTISDLEQSILPCIEKLTESTQNGNGIQNTKTAVKSPDTNAKQQGVDYTNYERNLDVWNNYLDKSSRVVHTSVQTPSTFNLNGIKAKISKKQQEQQRKQMSELKYNSVLLRPISNDKKPSIYVMSAPKAAPCRQKISASKQQFLSAENLLPDNFKEQFAQHKTSLTNSVPRRNRYSKRDHVSAKLSRKNLSMDRIDHISSYYASRYSSDDSFEKPELDALHENCIFSPHKHKEILDTTQSIDNLNSSLSQFESNLMRYGSVASLETDIDSGETHETIYIFPDTNLDNPFGFQHLHQRSHSMSELTANTNKTKSSRGRFAERNFKKAKSLQTLETNIDDVFTAKGEGNLTRVPSVHELRVSKSLQKLNVPDWFKNSSVSRSGSTFSLYGSQRRESTSTTSSYGYPLSLASSPCPSVGPAGNPVVIKTRVTPHSARLIRSPNLPMTPERAPIAPTNFQLPSDKLRNKEKPKELMPIPIVPFSKLRLMFETKSSKDRQPVKVSSKSPTTPDPPMSLSVANTSSESPKPRSPPPTSKSKEMSLSASNPVKLPPSILKKPSSLAKSPEESSLKDEQVLPSAEKVEKKTMQQVEFTNGDLKSEPYSQRRIPQTENHQEKNGSLSKPDQTNSEAPNYQNEHNSKPVRYDVAPQSQKPPLQPKPNSRKIMPRNPVAANTTSQQSRKGKTYPIRESHVSDFRQFRKGNIYGKILFDFLQKLRFSRFQGAGPSMEQPCNKEQSEVGQLNTPTFTTSLVNLPSLSLKGLENNTMEYGVHSVYMRGVSGDIKKSEGHRESASSLEDVLVGLLALKEQHSFSGSELELARTSCDSVDSLDIDCVEMPNPGIESCDFDMEQSFSKDMNEDFGDDDKRFFRCQNCLVNSMFKYAKHSFRRCPYCLTYYCGRSCLLNDWQSHKLQCIYGQISSTCRNIIRLANRNPDIRYRLSRAARFNYLSHGKGCLLLCFSDQRRAINFLEFGLSCLEIPPLFLSCRDLKFAKLLGNHASNLLRISFENNADLKYILHVVIVVPEKVAKFPVPRNCVPAVQKSAKLRLSPAFMYPRDLNDNQSPLILTVARGDTEVYNLDNRNRREVSFMNIQRALRERGVNLRHQYRKVYDHLISYVAEPIHFSPIVIYPFDKWQQKHFMCIIMPGSNSEIGWVCDPDLTEKYSL